MSRPWLRGLGQGLGMLGAALCAAAGLRLMTVAVAWAVEARSPEPALASSVPPLAAPRARVTAHVAARATASPQLPGPLPTGEPLRLMLAVSAGAPRSEVYVNGSRLGLSPYLGDYTCKRGEKLKVEIVPAAASAPLIVRDAVCEGKTLRVQD
ncbi:MAG: hypothetical protein ABW217_02380 [Polyangiaceae bacterium]